MIVFLEYSQDKLFFNTYPMLFRRQEKSLYSLKIGLSIFNSFLIMQNHSVSKAPLRIIQNEIQYYFKRTAIIARIAGNA